MNNDKEIQDMILENEKLKKHIETLQLQIRSLEAGCACYRNSLEETTSTIQKREN